MAKRRRSARLGATQTPTGPDMDVGASRRHIRDYNDVADSDDEFHANRDEVLLGEAPDAKRRRVWAEREEFLDEDEEEVLSVDEEDEEEEEDEADQDDEETDGDDGSESDDFGRKKGRRGDDDEEEEELGWGTSKSDLYGADAIETEEQALEEEAEAMRLQKKQLQAMSAADYGFDEAEWQGEAETESGTTNAVVTEVLPQLQIAEGMSVPERLKLLKSRYPEFEPLSKELLRMRDVHDRLVAMNQPSDDVDRPNLRTKTRAASAYIGSLAMYFALLSSPASTGEAGVVAMSAADLRDHPVMDALMRCRDIYHKAERLPSDTEVTRKEQSKTNEVAIASNAVAKAPTKAIKSQPAQKSRAQRHAEAAEAAAQARLAERMQRTEAGLADLDALVAKSGPKIPTTRKSLAAHDADSDFGDEAVPTAREAAEKAQRRKSLRFYTSQIAQKANRRGAAGRLAGGDDDVPHRERLRDRQTRLNAEAEKRGQRPGGPEADLGGDSDDEDRRQAAELRDGAAGDDDGYYDLVAARTAKRKADRSALAAAQRAAAEQGGHVVPQETVGADGKRAISYAIEKNKGLTPHRKKEVRNPRVKKRKKYEEKQKKLSSTRAVYRGGEPRGGYGGELTGIKKGLVKSTKL